jgi:hypothetical protein
LHFLDKKCIQTNDIAHKKRDRCSQLNVAAKWHGRAAHPKKSVATKTKNHQMKQPKHLVNSYANIFGLFDRISFLK